MSGQTGTLGSWKKPSVLPGFGLTLGYTLLYLSVIVLIPIAGLFLRVFEISWADFWRLATTPRALAAGERSFQALLRRLRVRELQLSAAEAAELTDWDCPEDVGAPPGRERTP